MKQILVTGPQRSGTTIAAHIFASDLGLQYIDEEEFSKTQLIPTNSVVQAPFALKASLELSLLYPDLHIIFMVRPKEEILESMNRVDWQPALATHRQTLVDHYFLLWETMKQHLPNERYSELQYHSLEQHPLFIKDRSNFSLRQWQLIP